MLLIQFEFSFLLDKIALMFAHFEFIKKWLTANITTKSCFKYIEVDRERLSFVRCV